MSKLRYGVAYYDEYMPHERLQQDIELMQQAGINTVRIAESTWSTLEPQNGQFDFQSIDRVLTAMYEAGIDVIIGTPTYAIPPWLAYAYPDVLAITPVGKNQYGPRQNMDITNPNYLFHAERVIRKLMEHVCDHPAVIGYQADNETKAYQTSGPNVQAKFVDYIKNKYGTLDRLNQELGLNYWSNRINSWEEFPNVNGSINAGLKSEFARFQRELVTQFLSWQVDLINEYKKPGQFVTQNFDYEWRGYSFGVQPDVDHFEAGQAFDITGVDIYHPSQSQLTGAEIAFGGDMSRSLKRDNYFVMETQAQAFPNWTPFPGQLRLQAFSHVASGADMVSYWHFHSIHNSFETYWKGLLSHDFLPNPTYLEAITIGRDFARLGHQISHLKIKNEVAVLVSNEALTALEAFHFVQQIKYNDQVRAFYDALYHLNIGCDFISPKSDNLESYKLIVVPALYAAPDELLHRLNDFVKNGGHVIYGIRSGFAGEFASVRTTAQPGIIEEVCGVNYTQFVYADRTRLIGSKSIVSDDDSTLSGLMELLTPNGAEVLLAYDHPHWGSYAAATFNRCGTGSATYIGCQPHAKIYEQIIQYAVDASAIDVTQSDLRYPLVARGGVNQAARNICYIFNYSDEPREFLYNDGSGTELLTGKFIRSGDLISVERWGVLIIEQ